METNNLQKRCVEVVKRIDKKYDLDRDKYLTFTQLVEEIGELGREVNTPKLRNKEVLKERHKMEL